jgi:pimeloyl-ACP methyl ester carboxylesterase
MSSLTNHLHTVPAEIPDADGAAAPRAILRCREWLTVVEYLATRVSGDLIDKWPHGDGHSVVVLPGFLAGPQSTTVLRGVLRRLGYRPHDWGMGYNLGYRDRMGEDLPELVGRLHEESGQRVSLIGWSAGGIYARELARMVPDQVRMVITLGSPFRGDHRASHAWRAYALFNPDVTDVISEAARIGRAKPLNVPTTCIYSRNDGIVAWECCTSLPARRTENVEVHGTHFGYGHNLEALYVIADRLAQTDGRWRPFES